MDIVGGAYGGSNPRDELKAGLKIAREWLEAALGHWGQLTNENRLEMLAASLLSVNRLEMRFDEMFEASTDSSPLSLEITHERPNLVDLSLERQTARVKLEFRNEALVGESECQLGLGPDHAAPARATLDALDPLLSDGLALEDARVLQIVNGPFAVVTLRHGHRLLVCSALIENDLSLAMARATLDAANRLITGSTPNEDRAIQLA